MQKLVQVQMASDFNQNELEQIQQNKTLQDQKPAENDTDANKNLNVNGISKEPA